jgi:hypothetical protein
MIPLIRQVVRIGVEDGGDVLDHARQLLLRDVVAHTKSLTVGAALMGVSTPTYKRWVAGSGLRQGSASCGQLDRHYGTG